jgi:hypothetical protein
MMDQGIDRPFFAPIPCVLFPELGTLDTHWLILVVPSWPFMDNNLLLPGPVRYDETVEECPSRAGQWTFFDSFRRARSDGFLTARKECVEPWGRAKSIK